MIHCDKYRGSKDKLTALRFDDFFMIPFYLVKFQQKNTNSYYNNCSFNYYLIYFLIISGHLKKN